MPGEGIDPLEGFRTQLQKLFVQARRPTYRSLEAHAAQQGQSLPTSTVSSLLNGSARPRWETVEAFVGACARYTDAHRVPLADDLVDLDQWHTDYRAMENALADRAAARERIAGRPVQTRRRRLAIPAQLPPATIGFTGRTHHLSELDRLLPSVTDRDRPTAVAISAIDGTAGVGKSALAVHWAHRVRDRFPDGQLYVNLRGFDASGQIMDPTTAVQGFLGALEVPAQRIPADPQAQAALYRSLLVGRRMLVVLDNARDSAQVRPLLPGAPTCLVVVTSRRQLTGLVAATGAHPLTVDLLTSDEARDLLTHRLGAERTTAEPDAVEEIITRCARLPLALGLVAAHAALRPYTRLQTLAEQLCDARQRWHTLTGDDSAADVRGVFSWSYRSVTPEAARLFRLFGLHPGFDIGVPAAASLAARATDEVRPLFAELVQANLVTERPPGRYTVHDLLRAYATEQAHTHDPDTEQAVVRLLDHYLHTAQAAAVLLEPRREPVAVTTMHPAVVTTHLADYRQAVTWSTTERPALIAAIRYTAQAALHTYTWQLTWLAWCLYEQRAAWHDWVAEHESALVAARHRADPRGQTYAHRGLGLAYARAGRFDDAHGHLERALDLCRTLPYPISTAEIHVDVARLLETLSRFGEALGHAQRALELYRTAGHRTGQANCLNMIGWYRAHLGDHRQSLTDCRQALTHLQELGDADGQAATWDSLGYAHHHLGNHQESTACYQRAIAMFRELGDRYYEARILTHLADAHHATGHHHDAREAWRQALAILDELDHPEAQAVRDKLRPSTVDGRGTP